MMKNVTKWLEIFQLMKNPKWSKTHVKLKGVYGASLCKFVDEFHKGTTIEPLKEEIPTCMDCRALMVQLSLYNNRNTPSAIAISALKYISYAHTQEKYHGAKI